MPAEQTWLRGYAAALPISDCPPNTRDQLRGAHDLTLVHDERAEYGASTRLQPPLVSCIALLGDAAALEESESRVSANRFEVVVGGKELMPSGYGGGSDQAVNS